MAKRRQQRTQDAHKILPSGYHHVRFDGWAHGFAQWPAVRACEASDVSLGTQAISVEALADLVRRANAAATGRR